MALVPFHERREAFHTLKQRVVERYGDQLRLCITDVRHDRYGLYRPGQRKAVILIYGTELSTFDLDRVPP